MDDIRDKLPTENHDVWCERCHRVHGFWAMTRDEYDAMIANRSQQLADSIDASIASKIMQDLGLR